MTRVQIVMLATEHCCETDTLATTGPASRMFDASVGRGGAIAGAVSRASTAPSLFIVDPLGNLMMRHEAAGTSKDLLTDLKKLLKLSHIG